MISSANSLGHARSSLRRSDGEREHSRHATTPTPPASMCCQSSGVSPRVPKRSSGSQKAANLQDANEQRLHHRMRELTDKLHKLRQELGSEHASTHLSGEGVRRNFVEGVPPEKTPLGGGRQGSGIGPPQIVQPPWFCGDG